MKIKQFLSYLPQLLLACQAPSSQIKDQEASLPQTSKGTLITDIPNPKNRPLGNKVNMEYLEWRNFRINNKLPLKTTIQTAESFLGKPDSITKVNFDEICPSDFRSENSKIAYYGGVTFEQFGDSLDFMSIDFSKAKTKFLQSGGLRLDYLTTPEVMKAYFPKIMENYGKDGREDVGLPPSKEPSEGKWLLIFNKGKLMSFEDWFPC